MAAFDPNFDDEQNLCAAIKQVIRLNDIPANTIDLQEIQNEFHQNGKNLDTFDVLNENSYKSEYEQSNKRNKLRETRKGTKHCVFCENNNEPPYVYQNHPLRDAMGRVLCPRLRNYVCPACGSCGDNAHTLRYCEKRPILTIDDTVKMDIKRRLHHFTNNKRFSNKKNYIRSSNNIRL